VKRSSYIHTLSDLLHGIIWLGKKSVFPKRRKTLSKRLTARYLILLEHRLKLGLLCSITNKTRIYSEGNKPHLNWQSKRPIHKNSW